MALDSIAKLSVLITGDESPLAASTNRAEQIVANAATRIADPWARGLSAMKAQNDKWAAGLANLAAQNAPGAGGPFDSLTLGARQYVAAANEAHHSTVQLSTVMAAMRGNIPAIFKVGGRAAGPALVLIGTAVAAYKLGAAADALHTKLGAAEIDTWAGQWKRIKEEWAESAGIVGGPLAFAFKEASEDLANLQERFNEWIKPDRIREMERHMATLAAQQAAEAENTKRAAEAMKAKAEAVKEAAEAAERERDANSDFQRSNFSRADAIRDMVRTPGEELQRFTIELKSLFASGFIDQETMNRALEMAEQKARDAVSGKQAAAARSQQPLAAVERFTSAGFTAVQQAQNNIRVQEEHKQIAVKQLTEEQKQVMLLQRIEVILQNSPTSPFALSRLN